MNTTQEHEFAGKIAGLLSQSTQQIDGITAAKLLAARKEALAHFQDKPARGWVPALVSNVGNITEPFSHNWRAGLVLLALLVSLTGVVIWHNMGQPSSEIAEIDEGLLTDELPINAYLDKGFDSWVKRHAR